MINRIIKLPKKSSFFLFGPRQTGKSTLINSILRDNAWKIDLLKSDDFITYSKNPELFRIQSEEKIQNASINTIFIDEIQRIPILLNEVHYLIEKYPGCRFILTGSSARKLKRKGVNLLAGRAVERHLFPYIFEEIENNFNLENILRFGSLPAIYEKKPEEIIDILRVYVTTYLEEEIKNEGICRNLGGFSRFLDIVASQNGELVNFSSIGRDCQLPKRTVQGYFEILEDTLIGFRLMPWRKSPRKRLTAHSKFYLFDTGVTNAINRKLTAGIDPAQKGRLFEHFVILETLRKLEYSRSEASIYFWRTNNGAEVDLLIEKHDKILAACEIKLSPVIESPHLSGLRAFEQCHPKVSRFIISTTENTYERSNVKIIPWKEYFKLLDDWFEM